MSDTVSTGPRSTSRRALIGGLAVGAAAVVAETVKPSSAQASQGQPVIAGDRNTATDRTALDNVATSGNGIGLALNGATFGGHGLIASSFGGDPGVMGVANGASNGVAGQTADSGSSGIFGINYGGGYGVAGRSNAANGIGVYGEAFGTDGVGLYANSGGGGTALQVIGKAAFSRSGTWTIPAGANHAVLSLDVTPTSVIFATLQQHAVGFRVESAVPHNGSFTIWINKPAPAGGLSVGWFVIN